MCLYPRLYKNKKYQKTKKNGGNIPAIKDGRTAMIPVACGKCMECRKAKCNEWRVRLLEELKHNDLEAVFFTFSFSDESLYNLEHGITNGWQRNTGLKKLSGYNLDNKIAQRGFHYFRERFRARFKRSPKCWAVSELGQSGSERIHWHGILWLKPEEKVSLTDVWSYGHIYLGDYVNERTINYIVKYLNKVDEKHQEYMPKMIVSPGIGRGYMDTFNAKLNKFKGQDTREYYRFSDGTKVNLPVYYRNKLYSEEEREELWINKLDKNVRYVLGKEINIRDDDDHYFKVLEEAQRKNRRLGFGDDTINWEKRSYENQRRNLLKLERLRNIEKNG